jgi:putative transcriptional regulator
MLKRALLSLAAVPLLGVSMLTMAEDLSEPIILAARPEFQDVVYGSTVLVVAPLSGDRHIGFIVNRPTRYSLGDLFPEDGPSRRVHEPVYFGGPVATEALFALVERTDSPGGKSLQVMPGLYAALDQATVDQVIAAEPDHARFVAGVVFWRPGELREEIDEGAWYTFDPDAELALRKPDGLWEELVRRAKGAENTT